MLNNIYLIGTERKWAGLIEHQFDILVPINQGNTAVISHSVLYSSCSQTLLPTLSSKNGFS